MFYICSYRAAPKEKPVVRFRRSHSAERRCSQPIRRRSRSIGARGAARSAKFGGLKPAVNLSNGGVSVAVVRDGRTRRREMAPQPVEMSRFAAENAMAANASDLQHLGRGPVPNISSASSERRRLWAPACAG